MAVKTEEEKAEDLLLPGHAIKGKKLENSINKNSKISSKIKIQTKNREKIQKDWEHIKNCEKKRNFLSRF